MARIDHLDNPAAPAATTLVPSANVVVINDRGELLLIRRSDNGNWAVPGGAMDLGESIADTAIRETREESGIDIEITGLVGIYTNPQHVIEYTSDGEVRQEFSVVFTGRPTGGSTTASSESTEVRWVAPAALGAYAMHPSMQRRVRDCLSFDGRPVIA